MSPTIDLGLRLLRLAIPAGLGAASGAGGLFREPDRAVGVLNTYALTIGFPALVVLGLLDADFDLPRQVGFWLLWPVVLLVTLGAIALVGGRERGTLALVTAFGNVAYLGLPVVAATLPGSDGPAALMVAIHVCLAVSVGPLMLQRWSGGEGEGEGEGGALARVLRLPLFWAPLVGLAGRALPTLARAEVAAALRPLAASAAPVALFLLGLHLYLERERLRALDLPGLAHVALRLLLIPGLTLGLAMLAVRAGALDPAHARIHVVLAAMPAAITTFSIAHQAGTGTDRVAATIVGSTLLALLTLPLWTWLVTVIL